MAILAGGSRSYSPPRPQVREPRGSIPQAPLAWLANSSFNRPSVPQAPAPNANPSWGARFGRGAMGALDPRGIPHSAETLAKFMFAPPRSGAYKDAKGEYGDLARAVMAGQPEALGGLSTAAIPMPFMKMPNVPPSPGSRVRTYPGRIPMPFPTPLSKYRLKGRSFGFPGRGEDMRRRRDAPSIEEHLAMLDDLDAFKAARERGRSLENFMAPERGPKPPMPVFSGYDKGPQRGAVRNPIFDTERLSRGLDKESIFNRGGSSLPSGRNFFTEGTSGLDAVVRMMLKQNPQMFRTLWKAGE